MRFRVRTWDGPQPLPALDVTTGSSRVMAEEAASRAADFGWENVSVKDDGARALKGDELHDWIERHWPEVLT